MKIRQAVGHNDPIRPLISSARIEESVRHDVVRIWNRGASAGVLVVNSGEGVEICERLIPDGKWQE